MQGPSEARQTQPLESQLAEAKLRLTEAEETLRAIRQGEVDALVVAGPDGDQIFTLQGAETPYRFLVEEMNEGALLLLPDGTILYANARFAELAGAPLEQLIGAPWERCFAPENQQMLRQISAAASRLDTLIQGSLDYARAVKQDLVLQPVPLDGLIRGLVATYPNLLPAKADIQVEGSLPTVLGNEAALTQVFSNLLGNAVKFVPPGTRPRVQVRAEPGQERVRIWVQDNGIGIPAEAQHLIFDMFKRAAKDYEGTGIGLAVVRKMVERMGGRVGVESEPGKGSRFWVELRRAERPAAAS